MNLALDIDGVLACFHRGFSQIANNLFGSPIVEDINQVKAYHWWDWGYPLTKGQHNKVWREIDKNVENFWLNLKPLVSSEIFLRLEKLERENNSIYFITSRRDTAGRNVLQQTNEWVKKYTSLKNFSVIPTEKKGKILDGVKIDYFLDDLPENLIEAVIEAPNCNPFLLIRSYNSFAIEFIKKSHKYRKINIVYSVEEFLDIVGNAG